MRFMANTIIYDIHDGTSVRNYNSCLCQSIKICLNHYEGYH